MTRNVFSAQRTLLRGVLLVEADLEDFAFPVHSHEHVVVGLVTGGVHTSRYGLRRYDIEKGDVLLVNPGEVHDGRPSGGRGRSHRMLEVEVDVHSRICADVGCAERTEFQRPVNRDPALRQALSAWLTSLLGDELDGEREASAEFFGLVLAGGGAPGPRIDNDLAKRARARMTDERPHADSIGDLAAEIGASRYQLIRAFKRAFGLTPEEFRRQLRVERARTMLRGRTGLAAIAVAAGFSDQSHMTREFRRLLGVTPGALRRAFR